MPSYASSQKIFEYTSTTLMVGLWVKAAFK